MEVKKQIVNSLKKITGEDNVKVEFSDSLEHGDYTTNVAMQTAKGNPREIAEGIVEKLLEDLDLSKYISKIEVAGAGFINFWISPKHLSDCLSKILVENEKYGKSSEGEGKTVVIDYSSPNIAKRFSIGHLRSTIIGQALYNLYTAMGYRVIGDSHLGDWGTQFGVLIYMVEHNNLNPNKLSVEQWEEQYVEFHRELKENKELVDKAREAFKRLEEGDEGARNIWQAAMDTSISEYNKIYKRLGVSIDFAYGESFYEDKMQAAIDKVKKAGVAHESEGALAVEFEDKYKLPSNILVKSNGTSTYLARDLAVMYYRKEEWNPDLQIFEVGADQILYFRQVFALAEMMGLFNLQQLKHVAHGMVRFPDGKMSTRAGKTIKLTEVLDKAVERAAELGSDSTELAEKVGIGAIKYFDLKHSPTSEIVFDWDNILDLKGNSGPYLQYTYARAQSVIKKSGKEIESNMKSVLAQEKLKENSVEANMVRLLTQLPSVIEGAAKSYSPNLLANYLFKIAQEYNSFYNSNKIIGDPQENIRLAVTMATAQVLKNGLGLMGIDAPERM